MGIYDRDYERSYDTGSGWRDGGGGARLGGGGFAGWTANNKLLALLVAVYVGQLLIPPLTGWLCLPSDWWREPWRLYGVVTYALLHDPDRIYHLLFNCLAIFFFGATMESRMGGREYLTFFFVAAAFAGLVWSGAETAFGGDRMGVLLGASGGIAAMLVLFALLYPNVQVYLMGVLPVPAWLMAVLFIGLDVAGALNRSGNVAYTAHLGGALFGYLYFRNGWRVSDWLPGGVGGASGKGLGDLLKRRPKLRVHRDDEDNGPSSDRHEDRVDEILRKIQAQGQASLTREEQRILEDASRRYQKRRH